MYAAYLYILRAFDSAAASHLARSLGSERESADVRWPGAAVDRCDSPPAARPDSGVTGRGPESPPRAGHFSWSTSRPA
jgi:hypothetical protein